MRIAVNLATEPLRRDRPVVVGAVVLGGLLALTLALLFYLNVQENAAMAETRDGIARLEAQLRQLQTEDARLQGTLRQPANAATLERNVFLNRLILPKAVSWTRLFGDLERIMPPNVRLVSIRPQVTAPGQMQLDMVVGAQSGEPVEQMLVRLESSVQFGATFVAAIQPPTEQEPLYRYRVTATYRQP